MPPAYDRSIFYCTFIRYFIHFHFVKQSVNASSANFDIEYADQVPTPILPATEQTLTMRPSDSRISGRNVLHVATAPNVLISMHLR